MVQVCLNSRIIQLNYSTGSLLSNVLLAQGKGSNPLKVLIKENKVIYQMYKSAKFGLVSYCHYISLTLLNSDPVE